jgi:hypothetical protein
LHESASKRLLKLAELTGLHISIWDFWLYMTTIKHRRYVISN